jgi:phosphoribosyl 1,2-cyclic phosphodiesterase
MVFLESNYCHAMLDAGPYPPRLKSRVAGPVGHLSNEQAADVVASLKGTRAARVVLVHLSRTNNTPERALEVVTSRSGGAGGVAVEVLPHGEPRRFDVAAIGASMTRGPRQQLGFSFA